MFPVSAWTPTVNLLSKAFENNLPEVSACTINASVDLSTCGWPILTTDYGQRCLVAYSDSEPRQAGAEYKAAPLQVSRSQRLLRRSSRTQFGLRSVMPSGPASHGDLRYFSRSYDPHQELLDIQQPIECTQLSRLLVTARLEPVEEPKEQLHEDGGEPSSSAGFRHLET